MSELAGAEAPRRPDTPHDEADEGEPAGKGMVADVLRGLSREQKEVSPKYFYDRRGSELFEEITRLPEYYLTRAELQILRSSVRDWIHDAAPASLVELGAGSARKTRVILDAMTAVRPRVLFVPVDVSADFLDESAGAVTADYPDVTVRPIVADISRPLDPGGPLLPPVLFALLGSTMGNFPAERARALLENVRDMMSPLDSILIGLDLRPSDDGGAGGNGKTIADLEAAYDDDDGVTRRFNLNLLRVLNRELGTDFDRDAFEHRAFYDEEEARIEMHLVSTRPQIVHVPGGTDIRFDAGESIRTEISCKYDRTTVSALFDEAGLELSRWLTDERARYAMAIGRKSG